jgi:methionine-rich copper-binding protein CopC
VPYDAGASAAHVAVPLPPLAPGTYQVKWSALTVDDGHVVKGAFSFVVKP